MRRVVEASQIRAATSTRSTLMANPQHTHPPAQLAGKTVLVTGADRGLGQAFVDEALRRGARRVYAGTRQLLSRPNERVVLAQRLAVNLFGPGSLTQAFLPLLRRT